MDHLRRVAAFLTCLLALVAFSVPPAVAADEVPWLYENSDVPPDLEWHFGKLDNGLRYAVRENGVPPGQVSIRIRIDAGSLYEREHEQGFAHLLEHLLFRQSRYLGDGEAIPRWQRLGATFGSDTNAETTTTQTVYKLDLPNSTPASLDESFKLLSGMVTAPTLSKQNLAADVPIVLAEMRERGGAGQRVQEAVRQVLYKGQLLADRSPIGKVETLTAATPETIRAFYSRWYRPENVVVVVAGDFSQAQLENYIAKWFSSWKVAGNPEPAPSFGDPVAPDGVDTANPVGDAKVLVEPDLPRNISYAILRPWRQVNDTIVYNQGLMADAIAQAVLNRRLESRARAGAKYLVAQVNQDDVSRSVDATFISVAPLDEDWQAALIDARAVIADALENPPTQEEIDREVAELDVAFQVPVEQRRLLPGAKLADDLVMALDIRETVAAPEAVLRIFRETVPLFTPESILEHTRTLFSGTVTRALYVTPADGEADDSALRMALLEKVEPNGHARQAAAPIRFEDLPAIGRPGQVVALEPVNLLGIEKLTFENGVNVLMWPVREEPGRVTVKVRFGGGYRSFAAGDAPYIALGEMALVGSGVATLGENELDRVATGRKLGFDFGVNEASFEFLAETRPADLADQLYLFAAKLAMPRWDVNPFTRAKAAATLQYEAFSISPQGVLSRDLEYYQRGKDPRFHTPTPRDIKAATHDGFRLVWDKALKEGPVEVQIFGDFDKASAIEALKTTFGALTARDANGFAGQGESAFPVPKPSAQPVVLYHRGDAEQAAAILSWPTGGGSVGIQESRQLEILTQLFTNRLMDAVREKLGVSYAPYVYSTWPVDLAAGGSITAIAQVKPVDVGVFFATAEEIAADLIARPPTSDELARVLEPMRQRVTRAASSSAFFMNQIEGGSQDPARIASVRTILTDFTVTTPEYMQGLAARYLGADKSWRLSVLPEPGASGRAIGR